MMAKKKQLINKSNESHHLLIIIGRNIYWNESPRNIGAHINRNAIEIGIDIWKCQGISLLTK